MSARLMPEYVMLAVSMPVRAFEDHFFYFPDIVGLEIDPPDTGPYVACRLTEISYQLCASSTTS